MVLRAAAGHVAAFGLVVVSAGCGDAELASPVNEPHDAGPDACRTGERLIEGKGCLPAGVQDNGCAAGELPLKDGSCQAAGIPPEQCGEGFEPDGKRGCKAILPPAPCPKGLMALPGEKVCHEVAPCATGTWGDIPVEASTQYADAAYGGADSDGSAAKPWRTVHEAVAAAAPGAIVAVAAGSYAEDVVIAGKPVRLWGRCPKLVEIVGTGAEPATLSIETGATGGEVHGVAVQGTAIGLLVSGSQKVVVDHVWIHDVGSRGVDVEDALGATTATLTTSLVEGSHEFGVFVTGSELAIDRAVVRDTQSLAATDQLGRGIGVQDDKGAPATLAVHASVIENNRGAGVFVAGSDLKMEASVVRNTQPQADQQNGWGLHVGFDPATGRGATATVTASVLEGNRDIGVLVSGSVVKLEATVVRDTQPRASDQQSGVGIAVQPDASTSEISSVTLRASLVAGNHTAGVLVDGSDATIDATIVRDTQPQASDGELGRGVSLQDLPTGKRAHLTLRASVIEHNHASGVFVVGSNATIRGTIVRDTQPRASDQKAGTGIDIQADAVTQQRGDAFVHACVVEQNREVGLGIVGSDAAIDATVVRDTAARAADGRFGDGIAVDGATLRSSAALGSSLVAGNARAGVSSFGSPVVLARTSFDCNLFHVAGEDHPTSPFSYVDLGGNTCGCKGAEVACQVASPGLEPPDPIPPGN